jgi:hypothetical protein
MTVRELIERLQSLPTHAEVRVAMETVMFADEIGETEITIAQTQEAQDLRDIVYEGAFVGLYA